MSASDLSARILRYPLDLSGQSPDNFVEAEIRELPNHQNRAIVLSNGAFFTESVTVYDNITGEKLIKHTQYIAAQLVEAATTRAGKEICSVIIVTDPAVSSQVRVDYQAVGGPYILNVDALIAMIDTIDIDNRPIVWGEIIGKPDLFPAGHHLHDAGDVFGFEYMVLALEEIRKAIIMGDVASHDEIYAYINDVETRFGIKVDEVSDALDAHVGRVDNPHATTKAQVGLSNVLNYGVATQAEAEAGVINTKYMTPQRTKEAITNQIGSLISTHINDKNNPHQTTKAQVGLSNVDNFGTASVSDATSAVENFIDIFNTWYRYSHSGAVQPAIPSELTSWVYDDVNKSVRCPINSSSQLGLVSPLEYGDYDFQVELSSSSSDDDRIGIVLGFEVIGGVEYTLTAARQFDSGINTFVVTYNIGLTGSRVVGVNDGGMGTNPYGASGGGTGWSGITTRLRAVRQGDIITVYTTAINGVDFIDAKKIVIDLNSSPDIQKFKTSSKIGFYCASQPGSTWKLITVPWARSDKFMTPLDVREAINYVINRDLGNHINDFNNPHQTTKAQVGLGNVENYIFATQAEAEAGTLSDRYMSPLRVKQAITYQAIAPLTLLINNHVNRTDNPHATTKTQVGLGSVQNYGVATQAEAEAGTSNSLYMTPLRVDQAITAQAITPLTTAINAHANRTDNPHATTKAQVGLGSVANFGIATQATAEAGSDNTSYMTPLRSKQLINAQLSYYDARYVPANTGVVGSIHVREDLNRAYIWVNGAWRQFWPPTWQ